MQPNFHARQFQKFAAQEFAAQTHSCNVWSNHVRSCNNLKKKSVRETGGSRLDSAPHAPCAETVYQPRTTRPCHGGISRLPMRTRQAIVLETYRRDKGTTSGQLWFRLIYFVLHNPLQCLFFFLSLFLLSCAKSGNPRGSV